MLDDMENWENFDVAHERTVCEQNVRTLTAWRLRACCFRYWTCVRCEERAIDHPKGKCVYDSGLLELAEMKYKGTNPVWNRFMEAFREVLAKNEHRIKR